MNNRKFLYAPLGLLFVFALAVLVTHFSGLGARTRVMFREASLPFGYADRIVSLKPEGEAAGLRAGDRIESFNGIPLGGEFDWSKAVSSVKPNDVVNLGMLRTADAGEERFTTQVTAVELKRDAAFYAGLVTGFLYTYSIPAISILLAFWVAFLRPGDPLAWILILVLLGMSSFVLENYPEGSLVGSYRMIFFSAWALGMLLFGIYFPERWTVDKRIPWAKWLLIVPLIFQSILSISSVVNAHTGFNPINYFRPLAAAYGYIGFFVNTIAIGLFFAAFAHKSTSVENPDSRRRLKLLLYGTSLAITPTFLILLYRVFSGAKGSFFEVVPFWLAILSLLLLNLFPLTMAYLIVVQQAMDVKVVVRQGIQYALARNGVKVLQGVLLIGLMLAFVWILQNFQGNVAVQIAFVAAGFALLPLIDYGAKRLRVWIDKRFFREAYNAEQILLELSEDVRTMVETKPLLETVSSRISESLHVPQVSLLLRNGNGFEPAYALGYDTPPRAHLEDESRAVQTLKKNQHILIYDEFRETTSTPTIMPDERRQIEELNSQILLPVAAKNRLSGVISLSAKRSEEPYTQTDLRLLRSVATQTGLALENSRLTEAIASEAAQKERLNRELEIAREVQERLFPQEFPKVEGLEYYGACRPALGVGGDYYDFIELDGGKFGFAIGDVSGKGIGASLMMASLQASLRGQAIHSGDDLAGLMCHVNRLVYEASTTNRYATFFYAQLDPATSLMTYVNAGHNPPYILRYGDDEPILLTEGGPVIGMLPPMLVNYSQGDIELRNGDLIVGFTDGISEAMNPQEEEWGEEALLAELARIRNSAPQDILEKCVEAADRFANGAKQHDDMTMIVISVTS